MGGNGKDDPYSSFSFFKSFPCPGEGMHTEKEGLCHCVRVCLCSMSREAAKVADIEFRLSALSGLWIGVFGRTLVAFRSPAPRLFPSKLLSFAEEQFLGPGSFSYSFISHMRQQQSHNNCV